MMNIVLFGPERRLGALSGDVIVDLARADSVIPATLLGLIEAGDGALAAVEAALAKHAGRTPDGTVVVTAAGTKLHAPHVRGSRICCAGGNFADHTAAMASRRSDIKSFGSDLEQIGAEMRRRGIWGFWKVGRDAAGPDDGVAYPSHAQRLDYEGELAVVLGKAGKDCTPADLPPMVWGITLLNDISIRDVPEGGGGPLNFAMQKNFDGSFSVGPSILVGTGIDWENTPVETYVNGERRQSFTTRDMVVKYGEYLAFATRDFTLHPGDMITSGTAAGTAADSSDITGGVFAPERFLKIGDTVEIRSPAIGSLRNTIVAKGA